MNAIQSKRSVYEGCDFVSASLQLSAATGFPCHWRKATPEEDMKQAIDMWYCDRYAIAVRGRTFTNAEYALYKDEFTIRVNGELEKLIDGRCTAIVYQAYDKHREPLGYTIISCKQMRKWFKRNRINLRNPCWHLDYKEAVTWHPNRQENAFYVFNLKKLNDWILYKQ